MHADSHFLHLGGSQRSNCNNCIASVIAQNAAISIKNSLFEQMYSAQGSRFILVESGAPLLHPCVYSISDTRTEQVTH